MADRSGFELPRPRMDETRLFDDTAMHSNKSAGIIVDCLVLPPADTHSGTRGAGSADSEEQLRTVSAREGGTRQATGSLPIQSLRTGVTLPRWHSKCSYRLCRSSLREGEEQRYLGSSRADIQMARGLCNGRRGSENERERGLRSRDRPGGCMEWRL